MHITYASTWEEGLRGSKPILGFVHFVFVPGPQQVATVSCHNWMFAMCCFGMTTTQSADAVSTAKRRGNISSFLAIHYMVPCDEAELAHTYSREARRRCLAGDGLGAWPTGAPRRTDTGVATHTHTANTRAKICSRSRAHTR